MVLNLWVSNPRSLVEFWLRPEILAGLILLSPVGLWADCLERIPPQLLPIFLQETAHVPHWRNSICSQIRAESAWNPNAESHYRPNGVTCCIGLGQIAGPTWAQESPKVGCAGVSRTDPRCNIRVTVAYMGKLLTYFKCGLNTEEPWEITRACFNAGSGNINKERKVCRMKYGCEESRWYRNREDVCRRHSSNCEETRTYVQRIQRYIEE